MNINALRVLIWKDLKLFFSDRRAMMLTLLVPVGIASFFGAILGGGPRRSEQSAKTPVLVVDADRSKVSQEIVANLKKEDMIHLQTATLQAARDSVLKGKTTAALVLPANFGRDASRAMFRGKKPVVQLLYDPSHNVEMQMLRGVLVQQVIQVVSKSAFSPESAPVNFDEQLKNLQSDPAVNPQDKAALKELFGSLKRYYSSSNGRAAPSGGPGAGLQMPYEVKEEAVTATRSGQEWSGAAHTFCGMAVQGLLFWAIDAGIGILRERQKGLWKRLRAAPVSRGLLLGGKIGSSTLISLFTLLVVFGWGALFFHVRVLGSVLGFLAVCLSTALMAATFGLLIATLGRTEQQSRGYAIPAVLAMASLGGVWFPVFLMPQWVQTLSLVIPARWAVDGFDAVTWRGLGLDAALRSSLILLGFAAAFWLIARLRFQWEADGQ
ncbi:MAG TPA: ABC transporter permease [Abditibacteriaceae bacterium]|jgi:ABC-2 type transport system permease protein